MMDTNKIYRQAQVNRLTRYAESKGLDPADVLSGKVALDLTPICNAGGEIIPDAVDYLAIGSDENEDWSQQDQRESWS